MADSLQDMRKINKEVVCEAVKFGLRVNTRNTEVMKIKREGNSYAVIENQISKTWKKLSTKYVKYGEMETHEMRLALGSERLLQP